MLLPQHSTEASRFSIHRALIGEVFSDRREKVVIATKAGIFRYDKAPDYSPCALRHSVIESLRRLNTDYIDLLQLHNPTPDQLSADPDIFATLEALRREGYIRAYGCSPKSPEDAVTMIRDFAVPVVQINLNMLDIRAVTCGVMAAASFAGAGIIARTPLCFGFLTGTLTAETIFPPQDHRSRWPKAQIRRWIEAAGEVLQASNAPSGQSPSQIALRYCLSYPEVASAIPGILTREEVEENAAASAMGPLPPSVIMKIEAMNREQRNFLG